MEVKQPTLTSNVQTKVTQQLRERQLRKKELEGVWIKPDEVELADNNLRTTRAVQIMHTSKGGPTLIEDDERLTRAVRRPGRRQ
jgi:hypothetical protein